MPKIFTAAVAAALLAGCASGPNLSASEIAELHEPLECEGKAACDLMWRRTQAWIAQNCGYKLQVSTDTVVETYNPTPYSRRWACRAVRDPMTETRDRINLIASCGPTPLCGRAPENVVAEFRRQMREAR